MATVTGFPSTTTTQRFKTGTLQGTTTVPNTAQRQQVINKRINANLTTLLAWVAAHPTGATLTAAQTLVLAKMMIGLCRLLLGLTTAITGT